MSNETPKSVTRTLHPADRCFGIMADLRTRIVAGELPPGTRLPTRRELADRCRTTLVTVQKALSRLEAAGFVDSRGRDGSYVAAHPPHLFRFGIAFAELPTSGSAGWHWSKFWSLLARAAEDAARHLGRNLANYSGIANWSLGEDAQRLMADVEQNRLAGLIAAGPVEPDSPLAQLVRTHSLPVVQIASNPRLPTMSVGMAPADAMVVQRLKEVHCQDLALLMPEFIAVSAVDQTAQRVRDAGIAVRESNIIGLDPREPRWIRNWTRLLMESARPPQALWITDDNLLEQAVLGLRDAGVVIGRDLTVIAHANLPLDTPNPTGVIRYGVEMGRVAELALQMLIGAVETSPQGKRGGQKPLAPPQMVPPHWMEPSAGEGQ